MPEPVRKTSPNTPVYLLLNSNIIGFISQQILDRLTTEENVKLIPNGKASGVSKTFTYDGQGSLIRVDSTRNKVQGPSTVAPVETPTKQRGAKPTDNRAKTREAGAIKPNAAQKILKEKNNA